MVSVARAARAALSLVAIAAASDAATPPPPSVRIVRQEARWTGPAAGDILSDNERQWYVISGVIENAGARPVRAVKLGYDLLDGDGVVVAHEFGYNHGAEDLRRPDYEAGAVKESALDIRPIAPRGSDSFRMLFLRSDARRFKSFRVRILEVREE